MHCDHLECEVNMIAFVVDTIAVTKTRREFNEVVVKNGMEVTAIALQDGASSPEAIRLGMIFVCDALSTLEKLTRLVKLDKSKGEKANESSGNDLRTAGEKPTQHDFQPQPKVREGV